MKYPIGIQSFERIIKEGYVYVDKTDLVYSLVNGSPIYFLSRPRRFGKSLLVSTLENYFLGNKEVFKGLAIEKLEKEWKKYPVFHIDFNGEEFFRSNALDNKILGQLKAWEQKYNVKVSPEYSISTRFSNILEAVHEQTGLGCVVLVDYLIRLLNHSDKKLDELTNKYYMQSQFIDYKADKEELLPMIYQSGYLTIKGVDEDEDDTLFLLDFPNDEVKRGFVSLVGNNFFENRID